MEMVTGPVETVSEVVGQLGMPSGVWTWTEYEPAAREMVKLPSAPLVARATSLSSLRKTMGATTGSGGHFSPGRSTGQPGVASAVPET